MIQLSYFSKVVLSLCILIAGYGRLYSQHTYDVLGDWIQYSDVSNALYRTLSARAFEQLTQRESRIAAIGSLDSWEERQREVKKTLLEIVGPFPERTPLNAKVIRKIKKKEFTVENIIFESQPGFFVTSSLFIPNGNKRKMPAILNVIGHSMKSYRRDIYQHEILNLVLKGFIVMAIDPVGQGERLQYYNEQTGETNLGSTTREHSYAGAQAFITGSSLAKYEIWDGIRAIDYLFTRKEVDTTRLGVTGLSGGGTQSAYLAAFDERIYAAAPANYITSFRRLLESIGPQDAEQNLPHQIARGLDHADFLGVRAPKPTMMITTTRDFFSIQGARETAKEVSRVFEAYGKGTHFRMVEDDSDHSFTKKNNEAMYAFFQKFLSNPGDSTDWDIAPLPEEELRVTATGQLSTSFASLETVHSLNLKEAQQKMEALKKLRQQSSQFYRNSVLHAAMQLSGYREPKDYHKPVFTGRFQKEGYVIEKYFVKGSDEYVIPYLLFVPEKANGKGIIYLHPKGKSAVADSGYAEAFLRKGITVLAPDLLGTGEVGNGNYKGDSFIDDISYGIWHLAVLTGKSILALQAEDISRLVSLIKKEYQVKEVLGWATGTLSSAMLHAAVFNHQIEKIWLYQSLSSLRSLVSNRYYHSGFVYGSVAGALPHYDLPDLMSLMAPRELTIIGMRNGVNEPVDIQDDEDIAVVRDGYRSSNSSGRLSILNGDFKLK